VAKTAAAASAIAAADAAQGTAGFSPSGISVFAAGGGGSRLVRLDAWEMGSAWLEGSGPMETHLKLREDGLYYGNSVAEEGWYGETWGNRGSTC
jgi:hypothetical protein